MFFGLFTLGCLKYYALGASTMYRSVACALIAGALSACSAYQPHYLANPANDYLYNLENSAPTQQPQRLVSLSAITERTKPQMMAWSNCVLDETSHYMQANEQADVTVRSAMVACSNQENDLQTAIAVINYSGVSTSDLMSIRRKIVYDKLVQLVIAERVNLMNARTLTRAWTDCLVDETVVFTKANSTAEQIISSTYSACERQELNMRQQLATFSDNPDAIINDRKKRLLPLLNKFVTELKALGKRAPKPDMQV
jgi:hypothetical protein